MCECNFNPAAARNHPPKPRARPNRSQQHQRSGTPLSKPICRVCNNLDPSVCPMGISTGTHEELRSTALEGCISCSMILKGITKLYNSLPFEHRVIYNTLNFRRVEISLPKHYPISINLYFSLPGGGFSTLLLDLFSTADSCVWPAVHNSPDLPMKLDISRVVENVTSWIENCNSLHQHCVSTESSILPHRVVWVGTNEDYEDVRLVMEQEAKAQYVALSYCWGDSSDMIKTTKSSIQSLLEAIPWQQLPKTFQDAIKITRELGIQYLWIDALCIIQDDLQDWETQAASMAQIYSNSHLTIAATAASDSRAGLFHDRWTSTKGQEHIKIPITSCKVTSPKDETGNQDLFMRPNLHLAHDRFKNMENASSHILDAPLLTRAWPFQERLLPSRTLHFHAEELIWECKSSVQCECSFLDKCHSYDALGMQGWLKNFMTGELYRNESAQRLGYMWLDLVSEFCALNLTQEFDRLPAISGLACQFFNKKTLGRYVAGIWEHDLARGLLFETVFVNEVEPSEKDQNSAPSWSWASSYILRGNKISYSHILRHRFIQHPKFSLLDLYLKSGSSNPYSWLEKGLVHLKGPCTMARITREDTTPAPGILSSSRWKIIFEIGGSQRLLYLDDKFTPDLPIEKLENTPLLFLLVGSEDYSGEEGMEGDIYEYLLVLKKIDGHSNVFRRVGLLLVNRESSIRDEKVAEILLG